jgi:hypothetical protein
MVSYLNPYCNFINVSTKDGLTLLLNATDKFESPFVGDQCISLCPGRNDFQLLKDNLTRCSQKYGYQYLLTDVATTCTVTPGVAPALDDITYSNPIKIMDVYDNKLLELAQKHTLLTWGNDSFMNQSPRIISDLTAAGGHLTTAGCLTQARKDFIQGCLHSTILAHQILSMLTDDARQVIECQSDKYTWSDLAGLDEEMGGMTIVALVLHCLCPHHKVDMYAKIGNVKRLMLAQYDRTEQLRKLGKLWNYYLDQFNQKGVFIHHKQRMQSSIAVSTAEGGRAPSRSEIFLGSDQLSRSVVEHVLLFILCTVEIYARR